MKQRVGTFGCGRRNRVGGAACAEGISRRLRQSRLQHGLAADLAQPLCPHLRGRLELFAGLHRPAHGVSRGAGTGGPGCASRAAPPSRASGTADARTADRSPGMQCQRSRRSANPWGRAPGTLADGQGGSQRKPGDAGELRSCPALPTRSSIQQKPPHRP